MSIPSPRYDIQCYLDGEWVHWHWANDEAHARRIIENWKPSECAPACIRAMKIIESYEILCVAGTARDIALPPQPGVDYSKESS